MKRIYMLLLCLGLVSCTEDESFHTPDTKDSNVTIQMKIDTPAETVPKVTTRSQTENEAKIQEIMVLVFKDNKFQYMTEGQITSSTVASTIFTVTLNASSDPLTLYLVANSNSIISSGGIAINDSQADVKEKLNMSFSNAGISYPFPMFGEHDVSSISSNGNNDITGIKMLRSIARVDVTVADAITNFELVSIQLFRVNSEIQIMPDLMTDASVTSPSIPGSATANIGTTPLAVTGNKSEAQLYVPESEAPLESNRISEATCIVVGGKYNGSSTTTYYRMDFNPGITGHPYGQILRNHKYTFNIKNVGVEGADTPEDAANAQSTGITVEVESWDEKSINMWYEGEGYFSVSARTVFLRPWAGTFKQSNKINVNTSLPEYSIQWCDVNGTPVIASFPSTTSISNSNYIVSIVNDAIQVEALNNNEQTADRLDYFVIHAGKWDIVITIDQYGLSKHMNDLVRVLSFYEIGYLGSGYADETTSGAVAMRQILNKQFSPGGVFKFGGYYFSELTRVTSSTTVSTTVLSNSDVVYFPYNQQPSLAVCDNVMNWLNAKTNRVLIIGADYTNTNVNLLAATGDNLGWNLAASATTTLNIVVDGNNELFTNYGLFGSISSGSTYRTYDGTWGRTSIANSQITPLITTNDGSVVLGVNMSKRIVYIGETQFFYNFTGSLSNATGSVSTDQDKLMANLWAWITEVVLSGK